MAKEDLIPFTSNQSRTKAKENGRKGGIASGIAKRERRTMRELLELVLAQEITNKNGETATKKEVIAIQLANQAVNGNLKAIDTLTKLTGDQIQKTEVTGAEGKPLIPEKMDDAELLEKIERLKNVGNEK